MKELYLLRHAEKDVNDELTRNGRLSATRFGRTLPKFAKVISSNSPRTILTAKMLTGVEPVVDSRAGYYETTHEKSDAIASLAIETSTTFLEAAYNFQGGVLEDGINEQADRLNELINETLDELADKESALIISHDMTINPAMISRVSQNCH